MKNLHSDPLEIRQALQDSELAELRRLTEIAESKLRHTTVGHEEQEVGLRMPGGHGYEVEEDDDEEDEDEEGQHVESAQDRWLREQQQDVGVATSAGDVAPTPRPPRQANEGQVDGATNGATNGASMAIGGGLPGSLEDALAAYGLSHLWPTMRDEELDCETYCAMEVSGTNINE